ncbi:MBL fold metallo-hydrolase [Flavobacterium sp. HBTb2-11-1]|uniref:MBL fold metallo-hydrolase n=1 Tax=Flavobacterium sp. HBTb2-11-1 TaxID=2692212 RepID=UPI001368241A|nr:MBL fold metallo-hydrolase [Flavobacterium sp. HBTb2-11-1]MXO04447.1 MBL fold metallo-hydrolase [Flavobacterium sp. HBTb2-11-1]
MKHMEAKFSFYKAGQGSFYGGRIWQHENNKVFTVVYDCGTSSFIAGNSQSLNSEINHFKHLQNYFAHNNEIELLFISHLDYDHVSGLKRLLTEFNVKNVILPYIEKEHRKFFFVSVSDNIDPQNDLSVEDYILFIESPITFIGEYSKETKIYFVKPNEKLEIEYEGYDAENQSENIYSRGNLIQIEELENAPNVFVYDNNLQFFIQQKWEFTTYVKSVNELAISNLHNCLKKKLKKKSTESLTLDDLKEIATSRRKEAHTCYTNHIGEINSHGLVLLHGPINYMHLEGGIYSDCELHHFYNDRHRRYYHYDRPSRNNNSIMSGTLLFGDTSINPVNNPIDFPPAFKNKLVNVHIVQVPHHGSSKNWDFEKFKELNIGDSINRWHNRVLSVCNFGYGNTYGHPSHQMLNDLRTTIFLNTQFSRLNIEYDVIHRTS